MAILNEHHKQMDAEHDRERGVARLFGHFVLCAAVPLGIAAIAEELGAPFLRTGAAMCFLWLGGVIFIWIWEQQDYIRQRNGKAKGRLDLWSKWLGLTAGAGAWWTWFV